MPRGRPRKVDYGKLRPVESVPEGPYTVWVDGEFSWTPKDFPTLQDAVEWVGRNNCRNVITKPVQYVVQEIGNAPRVSVKNGAGAEDLSGQPVDPDNPDSGIARYV